MSYIWNFNETFVSFGTLPPPHTTTLAVSDAIFAKGSLSDQLTRIDVEVPGCTLPPSIPGCVQEYYLNIGDTDFSFITPNPLSGVSSELNWPVFGPYGSSRGSINLQFDAEGDINGQILIGTGDNGLRMSIANNIVTPGASTGWANIALGCEGNVGCYIGGDWELVSHAPEPSTFWLLLPMLLGLAAATNRRKPNA